MVSLLVVDLAHLAVQKMFAELDADGSGDVNFAEFLAFMCKRKRKLLSSGKMAQFFDVNLLASISSFMADKVMLMASPVRLRCLTCRLFWHFRKYQMQKVNVMCKRWPHWSV